MLFKRKARQKKQIKELEQIEVDENLELDPKEENKKKILERQEKLQDINFEEDKPKILTPISQILAPDIIEAINPNYLIIDGLYAKFFFISDWPDEIMRDAWLAPVMSLGDGFETFVYLEPKDRSSVMAKSANYLRMGAVVGSNKSSISMTKEDVEASFSDNEYIKQQVTAAHETLYDVVVIILAYASDPEELEEKTNFLNREIRGMGFGLNAGVRLQEELFKMAMPGGQRSQVVYELGRRNILSSDLAGAFPFISPELSEEGGIFLGLNDSNSLVILDLFDRSIRENGNLFISGTSGSGKTYALQKIAMSLRMQKVKCFVIAHLKAYEYKRSCEMIGGTYVKIGIGSEQKINICEITEPPSENDILIYGEMGGSVLDQKIVQVMNFLRLATEEDDPLILSKAETEIRKVYKQFGFSEDNSSIYKTNSKQIRTSPILRDIQVSFKKLSELEGLATALEPYVTGSFSCFNGKTNVDLKNDYIVFDLETGGTDGSEKIEKILNYVVFTHVIAQMNRDKAQRKAIVLDELWNAISNPIIGDYVQRIFRIIRGLNGVAIGATQKLSDCFDNKNLDISKAIIENTSIQMLLKSKESEAQEIIKHLRIPPEQKSSITMLQVGEAILSIAEEQSRVHIVASPAMDKIISTSEEDLLEYAEKKRAEEMQNRRELEEKKKREKAKKAQLDIKKRTYAEQSKGE